MRVHGLQKKPEYNDLTGSVKREVEGGRWCIVLDKVGIELALKPDNFTQSELPKAAAEKARLCVPTRIAAHSLCRRCSTVRGARPLLTAQKVSGAGRRGFSLVY